MNETTENSMYSSFIPSEVETRDMENLAIPEVAQDEEATSEFETVNSDSSSAESSESKKTKHAAEEKARAAHEATEAKRKAEWEDAQRKKKEAREAKLREIEVMDSSEAQLSAIRQAGEQTERLVRRNMKVCVAEVVKQKCAEDPHFAKMILNPCKDMVKCFHYVTQKAMKYLQEEAEMNRKAGIEDSGRAGDVPDALCYQWAIEYFLDLSAEEDKEQEDKFIPHPFSGRRIKSQTSAKKAKPAAKPKPEPKAEPEKASDPFDQLTFS